MASIIGKNVLVTGASSGIGYETVLQLLEEGATVYAAARSVDKMKDLEAKGAFILAMDVSDEASMSAAFKRIKTEVSGIDILVNNAGYGSYGSVEDVPIEEARRQFEVNIFGLARLTQLVLPAMREKQYGKIVNISSMGGKVYTPFGAWYHATKHALEGWSDCLRLELKPFGIDVIIVEPGGIATAWGEIAATNLEKTSSAGAYAAQAQKTASGMKKMYGSGGLTSPKRIATTIRRSVTAAKPKTRYAVGYMAKPSIFLRGLLGDRIFDKIISTMMSGSQEAKGRVS